MTFTSRGKVTESGYKAPSLAKDSLDNRRFAMLSFVFRQIIQIIVLLPRIVLRFLHSLVTGRTAILDLEIEALESSRDRQKIFSAIRDAAEDDRIMGIVLRLREAPGGWATTQDLGNVIHHVRESGKPVYAFMEQAGNATTWLAAQCDRVFMVPIGEVSL